jgi:YHS domain-containing protein
MIRGSVFAILWVVAMMMLGSSPTAAGDPRDAPRLALKGYDPVAYFTMRRPVPGSPEFQYDVDGSRFYFATVEHLALFQRDPDHYAPQYRGLCTMGLAAKGYRVEANPENWVVHEGRLYVTQRSFGPAGFRKAPERWVVAAEENLELLEDTPVGTGLSWW